MAPLTTHKNEASLKDREGGVKITYFKEKFGISLFPRLLPSLICDCTQDKWFGQAGGKGPGEKAREASCAFSQFSGIAEHPEPVAAM